MDTYVDLPDVNVISEQGREWLNEVLPNFSFSDFATQITNGGSFFEPDKILNTILRIFSKELYSSMKILGVILAIMVIGAILENLRTSFKKESFLNSGMICVVLIIGLSIEVFNGTCTYAKNLTEDITSLMWVILPAMVTLLAGGGYTMTGAIAHPVLLFMCNVFAEVFDKVLIPLSVAYLAIALSDMMSTTIELGKLKELIKKCYNFLLGIVMTLFTGMLAVGSFAGVALDSVGARGVKFALSNMVPFVGRSLSDAMGAVVSASMMLKNVLGVSGIVCMAAMCIVPVIKIAVIVLCIRLSAAVCEPIANKKSIQVLTYIADSLSMINAAVIATMVMMVIALSIIVGING